MTDVLPDAGSAFGARDRARLRDEKVIWLTTTGTNGTPQPNPVWFLWQEPATILIYSRPHAHRLRHIIRNSRVALHFDGDGHGGDVVVLAGTASHVSGVPAPDQNVDYTAKYRSAMTQVAGSLTHFSAAYPVAVEITIDRVRGH